MSDYTEIMVITEGHTEQKFIRSLLAPYLTAKGIFMTATLVSKSGQKGGDVRFARVVNDIEKHLKQRRDIFVSLLVDYYGIKKDWPGVDEAKKQATPAGIAEVVNQRTREAVTRRLGDNLVRRFIPNIAVHELEALLFSDIDILSDILEIDPEPVAKILAECKEPEKIDDSPQTAPSKRLAELYPRYKKTSTGIAVAKAIGIDTMRAKCPVFNQWLERMENIKEVGDAEA